jgi:hypothetical protein
LSDSDIEHRLQNFAGAASEFVEWLSSHSDGRGSALFALQILAKLYHAGLQLPDAWSHELENTPDLERLDPRELVVIQRRLKELPVDFYAQSLEPLDVVSEETGIGALSDDFGDVYLDVLHGLRLYRSGRIAEARWEWAWGLQYHWGNHAVSAMSVLQCCYRDCLDSP